MAYHNEQGGTYIEFKDEPNETTPLSSTNLNNIQKNIQKDLNNKTETGETLTDLNKDHAVFSGVYGIKTNTLNTPYSNPSVSDVCIIYNNNTTNNKSIIQVYYRETTQEYWIREGTKVLTTVGTEVSYIFVPKGEWQTLYSRIINENKKVLYDNENGSYTGVTLNDDIDNYKYIDVIYFRIVGSTFPSYIYATKRIYGPFDGRLQCLNLSFNAIESPLTIQLCTALVRISGNKIQWYNSSYANVVNEQMGATGIQANVISICKVIGYKE